MSPVDPRKANEEVREATLRPSFRARRSSSSSAMPSARKPWSRCGLRSVNGSTPTELIGAAPGVAELVVPFAACSSRAGAYTPYSHQAVPPTASRTMATANAAPARPVTPRSRVTPRVDTSKNHEITSATGKPRTTPSTVQVKAQGGRPSGSKVTSAACSTTQPTTA